MAEKRMFARTILTSDAFLDMPHSTRILYVALGMEADDDGFVNNPKTVMRMNACSNDDLAILTAKKFIYQIKEGLVLIKHWKLNNYIQNDRYKESKYKEHLLEFELDENKAYKEKDNTLLDNVYKTDTQYISISKSISISLSNEEDSKEETKKRFTKPTLDQVQAYCDENNYNIDAQSFIDFYESKGWKVGTTPMKNWQAAIRTWVKRQAPNKPSAMDTYEKALARAKEMDGEK